MSELLPCPFCGSTDIYTEGPCYDAFMCNGCGVSQYDQPGHAEAIAAWNTRASQAEIERLREALKPFAQVAKMEHRAEVGASVMVNVERCRDALAALSGSKE